PSTLALPKLHQRSNNSIIAYTTLFRSNGVETGVDCGGPNCPACPTCNDGIPNGGETGVDCGGPNCPACPTCNDGIQNGGETGVDCGGPNCPACPTCNDGIQNGGETGVEDRKSTRLNSSHVKISYAVFCLKKKK